MLLSLIIPTCDRTELLSMCLNLLAPGKQSLGADQYQVIVTDDGKDALTQKMIEEKYPWVKFVAGPRKGPGANRNNGAKHAAADWLVFFDDDCLPAPDILETYKSYIFANLSIQIFEGKIERPKARKRILEYAPCNYNGGNLWSCNFAIHKSVFKEVGGFDENFKYPHLEDTDLKRRIDSTNRKIIFAVDATVLHPWRKINGKSLGRNEEMSIYFSSKYGENSSFVNYLKRIAGHHMKMMKRTLFTYEIFQAIKITSQHLGIVILNFHKWKKKYSKSSAIEDKSN